jgi:hypothetical protein
MPKCEKSVLKFPIKRQEKRIFLGVTIGSLCCPVADDVCLNRDVCPRTVLLLKAV